MTTATVLPFPTMPRLSLVPIRSYDAETGIGPAVAVLFACVVDGIDCRSSQAAADQQDNQDDHEDGGRARG